MKTYIQPKVANPCLNTGKQEFKLTQNTLYSTPVILICWSLLNKAKPSYELMAYS